MHGENDGLPALVVDRYNTTLVVKLYSAAWFPHLSTIIDALVELMTPERVVLRLARAVAAGNTFGLADGDTLVGRAPDGPVLFRERGLTMEADVVHGQKTGHYLDQRDNRTLVRGIAGGRDVLDVFASTGGFAVAAAAGGARSVHLVDQSAPALAAAERNLAHNRRLREVRECAIRTTVGDAFDVLAALDRRAQREADRFDVVVARPTLVRVEAVARRPGAARLRRARRDSGSRCCGPGECSCRRRARAGLPPTSSSRPCWRRRVTPAGRSARRAAPGTPSTTRSASSRARTSRRCSRPSVSDTRQGV